MAIEFVKDELAASQHSDGFNLALMGDFAQAHEMLELARRSARISDFLSQHIPSRTLQLSQINRDEAFTMTREAIDSRGKILLEDSYHKMVTCIFATTSLIDLGEEEFEEESWRLLQSEHGATLDLADRISVVNEIPLDRLAEVIPLPHYSLTKDTTWDYLLSGSNYDYSTSRAMDAARYERTKESGLHRDWLERAKEQLELAQQNDSGGLVQGKREGQRSEYQKGT